MASSETPIMHVLQLGRVPYREAVAIQDRVVAARKAGRLGDTLLLLEHPPVLTFGRNARREHILASPVQLAAAGVELHETRRGGDVTYHGPGQLIGWPVVDLRGPLPGKHGPHLGPVDFVRLLEEVLLRTCGELSLPAQRIRGRTGVWTLGSGAPGERPERKIAALGIHVSGGVTAHGFALNSTTDLRDFRWIVPCGIADRAVTSLEAESPSDQSPPSLEALGHLVIRHFGRVFGRVMLPVASLAELLGDAEQGTSHPPDVPPCTGPAR